jgi:ribosomal-protein-serine acetyltransferase
VQCIAVVHGGKKRTLAELRCERWANGEREPDPEVPTLIMREVLPDSVPAPRVTIRQWTEDDVEQFDAVITANIEHLRPWMPWIAFEPKTIAERLELIRTWQLERSTGGDCTFGVFLGGEPIGGTGLHRRIGDGGLEIGYWISADHLRRGYATEVSSALTAAAFAQPDIDRVEIHHDIANVPSGLIPKALGYTFIEDVPREITAPGEVGVLRIWRITRDEFESSRDASRGPGAGAQL